MNATCDTTELAAVLGKPRAGILRRTFRIGIVVVFFAVCCLFAYGVGGFWAQWQAAHRGRSVHDESDSPLDPLAATLPLAGQWSFDDLDWSVKSQLVDVKQLDIVFESLEKAAHETLDAELPDTDPELVGLITSFGMAPREQAGEKVYRLERADLKAELVSRDVAGVTKTAAVAIAYPAGPDRWQLFEFTPRAEPSTNSPSGEQHLLPLPSAAHRDGGRFGDDGQPLMEFISLDSRADDLLTTWKAAGWVICPSGFGDGHDFSYLCGRGNDVIYVWSADPPDALKNLMLVRSPATADTSP